MMVNDGLPSIRRNVKSIRTGIATLDCVFHIHGPSFVEMLNPLEQGLRLDNDFHRQSPSFFGVEILNPLEQGLRPKMFIFLPPW